MVGLPTDVASNCLLHVAQALVSGALPPLKHEDRIEKTVLAAHRFTSAKGTRVVCFSGVSLSSDMAEKIDHEADLIVGFDYKIDNGRKILILSNRSHTDFDCMTFARAHGGGGHTRAAGCAVTVQPEDPNPYTAIERILNAYETDAPAI